MKSNKIDYFEFLRGVAILMVIAIHASPTFSFETLDDKILILVRQIINCAVPIFLAISGFFLSKKDVGTMTSYFKFLKGQIQKVYIPCLIWSIPFVIFELINGHNVFKQFILLFLCGHLIYYFIALIIQCYILLPLFLHINKIQLFMWGCLTACSITIITYLLHIKGMCIPLLFYAGPFPVWIFFFALGIYIGRHKRQYNIMPYILLLIVGLILSYFESKFLYQFYETGVGVKISIFIYSYSVILILFSQKLQNIFDSISYNLKLITYIGSISFGIYLTHMYVLFINLKILSVHNWIVQFSITSIEVVVLIWIAKMILPQNILKYIGFK